MKITREFYINAKDKENITLLTQGFRTHKGELVKGERLDRALNKVADERIRNSYAIRKKNLYASHVTEEKKEKYLRQDLEYAESLRQGKECNFTAWQQINKELTGDCVAFLSK